MSLKVAAISWSISLILLVCSWFLYREMQDARNQLSGEEARRRRLSGQLEELRGNLEDLKARLARAREKRVPPEKEREAPPGDHPLPTGDGAVQPSPTKISLQDRGGPVPALLTSIHQADQLARDLLQRGDLRGLCLLAGDLLAMGPEGYEKLIALFPLLENKELEKQFEALWRDEGLALGPMLRVAADHHEDILRFGLYLDGKNKEELPKMLREVHKELLGDKLAPLFLGFYQGDDPEILNGYGDRYRTQVEQSLAQGSRLDDDHLWAMAQIPTEEMTVYLIDLLPRASGNRKADVVRALAIQAGERAIPILRNQLQTATDPNLIKVIEAALRYLE